MLASLPDVVLTGSQKAERPEENALWVRLAFWGPSTHYLSPLPHK